MIVRHSGGISRSLNDGSRLGDEIAARGGALRDEEAAPAMGAIAPYDEAAAARGAIIEADFFDVELFGAGAAFASGVSCTISTGIGLWFIA